MNYLAKFYNSKEEAVAVRDNAVNILNELDECIQKERLQEDIWDLNDLIDSFEETNVVGE